MQKANLDNKTLDIIGQRLVRGATPCSSEIEEMIANPDLFAAIRKRIAAAEASASNKTVRKRQTNTNHEPAGEFYALSTGYDQDETTGGGRIIRVDMPRSSLFALGVNIPLENDAEVVKADLLIGSDGMTHAIRVV